MSTSNDGGVEDLLLNINDRNVSVNPASNSVKVFSGRFDKNELFVSNSNASLHRTSLAGTGDKVNRFILAQVFTGRSFVVDDISEIDLTQGNSPLPDGYDSLYLALQNANDKDDHENDDIGDGMVDYRHNYAVFNNYQVLPLYFISFGLSKNSASKRLDSNLESKTFGNELESDSYDRYDFFDPKLYRPVSIRDKMTGDYSSGALAGHKLVTLNEAYQSAISESSKDDDELRDKLNEIRANLEKIDGKLNQVNNNAAKVEELLYETLQDALFYLQDETQGKLNKLLSEEVELRRQMQQVVWMQQSLHLTKAKTVKESAMQENKVDFLNKWKCFNLLKNDICHTKSNTDTVVESIAADMELIGGIEVISASKLDGSIPIPAKNAVQPAVSMPMTTPKPMQAPPVPYEPISANQPKPQPVQASINQPTPIEQKKSEYIMKDNKHLTISDLRHFSNMDLKDIPPALLPEVIKSLHLVQKNDDNDSVGNGSVHPPPPPDYLRFAKNAILPVTPQKFGSFSLHAEAYRKMRQMKLTCEEAFDLSEECFSDSRLISTSKRIDFDKFVDSIKAESKSKAPKDNKDPKLIKKKEEEIEIPLKIFSQAQTLLFCLPIYNSANFPEAKLLFASWLQSRDKVNVKSLINSVPLEEVDIEDETGKVLGTEKLPPTNLQCILIMKANGKIFGAYIDDALKMLSEEKTKELGLSDDDGIIYGSHNCFLFSMSLDIKIPFTGAKMLLRKDQQENSATRRMEGDIVGESLNKYRQQKAKLRAKSKLKKPAPLGLRNKEEDVVDEEEQEEDNFLGNKMGCVLSNQNRIQIGVRDLWLTSDLKRCGSQLEHTFGSGCKRGSEEASTLLAGQMVFDIDEIELWGLQKQSKSLNR